MKIFVKNENVVMVIFIFFFFLFNGVGNIKAETTTNAKILTSFSIFNGNYTAVEFISSQDGISKGISSTIPGKARWVAVTAYQYQYAINPNMPPTRLEVQEYVYKKNNTLSTVTNKNDIPTDADWVTATKLDLGDYIYSTNQNFNYSLDGTSILQGNLIPINAVWASLREVNAYGSWTNNTNYSNYEHIFLDTTPPTGSLTINDGASFTTSYNVTLKISQSDTGGSGDVQMQFSNDNGTWSGWENASLTKSWTLTSGDGQKTVFVKFRDAAGNETPVISNTINVDSTPPTGSLTINDGASFTASSNVTLNITQSDTGGSGDVQMQFSNDNGIWSEWENVAATKPWTLENGDGEKTVYVKLKDAVGNTFVISNKIVLKIPSSNTNLNEISLSNGTLDPAFSSALSNYTASVSNDVSWIKVTPTLEDNKATVTVNGTIVENSNSSDIINLNIGSNIIIIVVTAEDSSTKTYSITVKRPPAKPSVSADDTSNIIIGINETMEYQIGTGLWTTYDSNIPPDLSGNNKVKVRVKAIGEVPSGEDITLMFTHNPPEAPNVTADDINNKFQGANNTMEYSTDNGSTWKPYDPSNEPTFTGNLTVFVRIKAQGEIPYGASTSVHFTTNPPSGGYNGGGGNIPDPTPNPEPIIQAPEQVKTLMKDGKLQIKVKDPKTGELIEAKIESIQSIGGFFIVQIGEKGEISKGVELPQGEAKVVILDNEKPYSYFDIGIDTSPTKEWKVQFSAPLLDEIENLNNITVQDALGQKIDIKISLSKDGKAVNIIPNIPYKKDELYYITIVDSIGVNGQKQKDPIRKIFIIE